MTQHKITFAEVSCLVLLLMLVFLVGALESAEQDRDQALQQAAQQRLLVSSIAPVDPNVLCPAWWFGKGDVMKARDQICGRKK